MPHLSWGRFSAAVVSVDILIFLLATPVKGGSREVSQIVNYSMRRTSGGGV